MEVSQLKDLLYFFDYSEPRFLLLLQHYRRAIDRIPHPLRHVELFRLCAQGGNQAAVEN